MSQSIIWVALNISEGKDLAKIDQIVAPLKGAASIKLVSVEPDADYHRCVITILGSVEALLEPLLKTCVLATQLIDLTQHQGQHPRFGAVDVVPFIPLSASKQQAKEVATAFALAFNQTTQVPVFYYEQLASSPERENLATVRKGEFEGLDEKFKDPSWQPDVGVAIKHPTAGAVAVSVREPLIAYNIDLNTSNLEIAKKIAQAIRFSSGGLRYVKAGAVSVTKTSTTQVTMNITNPALTPLYRVFEFVKMEAARYGVSVSGSEVVGSIPLSVLVASLSYYLGLHDFTQDKIIDTHLGDIQ